MAIKPKHLPYSSTFNQLVEVMARLRDKESGCPWDKEQTFQSIVPCTLEEAYEVVDAIERENWDDLKEELGDLLLQVVFYAQMAQEENLFDINDVIVELNEKLMRRHPHVFGDQDASQASEVNEIWDAVKEQEKSQKNQADSALDGVTKHLPALLRSQKLQKKAAKVGFEWQDLDGFLDKCEEEIAELREAITDKNHDEIEGELGDVMFCLANLARHLGVNSEEALRKTNEKFIKRFNVMEEEVKKEDKVIFDLTVSKMLEFWDLTKKQERS